MYYPAGLLQLIIPHVLQMFTLHLTCFGYILGLFHILPLIYYTLYHPYVISVSTSCSSKGFLIFSLLIPHCFLKDTFLFPYGHIVVDTVLYPYTLPIDYSLHSYSSLCPSCNLSQT